jgi:predicted alpha/beta superfamily hydrolase
MFRVLAVSAVLVLAPAFASAQDSKPIVIGRSHTLASAVLGQERTINVWLPASYAEGKGDYPVVYLLDGGEAEDFHHITGLMQVGGMNGYTAEAIVVGIASIDRRHDLTYPSSLAEDRKGLPTSGGSAAFRRFIAEELQPWVAGRYRTSGRTVIMGESLAGLFCLETFLRAPQTFTDYVCVSPSLWWDKGALAAEAPAALARLKGEPRMFFMAYASDDGADAADQAIATALRTSAPPTLRWRFEPMPGERHATIYHPAATQALRWLFAPPPKP